MSDAVVTFADPHVPALGSTVGSWLLLERIDSGSYGVVFRARRAGHPESPEDRASRGTAMEIATAMERER